MNTPVSRDMTSSDLSWAMSGVAPTRGIAVSFDYEQVRLRTRDPLRNGKVETRLVVRKRVIGDRNTTAVQYTTEEEAARLWPREWAMFQTYGTAPTRGTPLSELPGMTESQIKILAVNGIESVEDLIEIDAAKVTPMGLEAIRAHKLARDWSDKGRRNKAKIDLADAEARHEAERDALVKRIASMEAALREAQAQISVLRDPDGRRGLAGLAPRAAPDEDDLGPISFEDEGPGVVDVGSDQDSMPNPLA